MAKTPAIVALTRAGVAFEIASYDYDPAADRVGLQAARAMGVPADQVFKTLMLLIDGRPACAILPADAELNMKKLAAAMAGKSAEMMKQADAERLTGYHVGGISPFGQRRVVPTAIDEHALLHEKIFLNAGQRGLQIAITPEAAIQALVARIADIVR